MRDYKNTVYKPPITATEAAKRTLAALGLIFTLTLILLVPAIY